MFNNKKQHNINNDIVKLYTQVRVISEDGSFNEVLPSHKALIMAQEQGVDLVEISNKQTPPICRIIEYSKFLYKQQKSKKEQKAPKLKEIKFTSTISDNDISYRIKHLKEFLSDGHKVKVTLVYKGRTITHADIGENKFKEILEQVKDFGIPQGEPKLEGRYLTVYLNPIKK